MCYLRVMSCVTVGPTVESVQTNQLSPHKTREASSEGRSFFQRLTDSGSTTSSAAVVLKAPPSTPHGSIPRGVWLGTLIVIAVVLYAVQAPVLGAAYGAGAWGMLLAAPASIGVVLAWHNPRAAVGVVLLGTAVIALVQLDADGLPFPWTVPSMLALFVCALVMGYSVPLRDAAITYAALIGISVILQVLSGGFGGSFVVMAWLSLVMAAIGLGVKRLRVSEARAKQQEEISEHERERREILEEKAKMARELHDVVAHHMSVITVQAASAEYRLENLSDEARKEFQEISEQSRSSLAELRRILGVLRGEDDQLQLAPQPGVEDLPRVIEHVARAGTHVKLSSSDLDGLGKAVSIATYRIVQEALSNVVRHAPGIPAAVVIDRSIGAVEITVTNPAPTTPTEPMPGSGLGLRGMRERASALGGTLSTGPTPDGGFEVRAWLPAGPTDEQSAWATEQDHAR